MTSAAGQLTPTIGEPAPAPAGRSATRAVRHHAASDDRREMRQGERATGARPSLCRGAGASS